MLRLQPQLTKPGSSRVRHAAESCHYLVTTFGNTPNEHKINRTNYSESKSGKKVVPPTSPKGVQEKIKEQRRRAEKRGPPVHRKRARYNQVRAKKNPEKENKNEVGNPP